MASFYDSVKEFFVGKEEAPAIPATIDLAALPAANDAPPPVAAVNAVPAVAVATSPAVLMTTHANAILHATLVNQPVNYYDANGRPVAGKFNAGNVTLKSSGFTYVDQSEEAIPHGESVTFSVALPQGVASSDIDLVSVNEAMVHVLKAIPGTGQHIMAKPAHAAPQTYEDVGKEVLTVLKAKGESVHAHDLHLVQQFFTAHAGKADEPSTWDRAIEARHDETGKVIININARALPSDDKLKESSDKIIIEALTSKRAEILKEVEKRALATGVVKPEQLKDLDLHIEASGWNIRMEFGTKATVTKDAEGHDLPPAEIAKKMTATQLAAINTKELEKIATDVLLMTNKELAPRFMDAPMLANYLRHVTHNDPQVLAVLGNHDMFKSADDIAAEHATAAKHHAILVEPARIVEHNGVPHLEMTFPLREHETLHQVLERIVNPHAQEKPGMIVGETTKVGIAVSAANAANIADGRAA